MNTLVTILSPPLVLSMHYLTPVPLKVVMALNLIL
jgi:hypothetical protein